MWRKLAPAVLLSLVLVAGIGASVADAEEYCVDGCIWGYTCPTQPREPAPGEVELPLCVVLPPGAPEPVPPIVEREVGEATSDTTGVVRAWIDSRGKGVRSLVWQYSVEAETVGGERAPVEPLEAPGSLEPERPGVPSGGGIEDELFRGSGQLTGLEPDTTYFYRAVVANGSGALEYGPTESFQSEPVPTEEVPSGSSGATSGPGELPSGGTTSGSSGAPVDGQSVTGTPAVPSASSGHVFSSGASPDPNASNLVNSPSRARELAKALRACRSKPRHARAACARRARKRFGKARGKA
jgi:hypothetical protein